MELSHALLWLRSCAVSHKDFRFLVDMNISSSESSKWQPSSFPLCESIFYRVILSVEDGGLLCFKWHLRLHWDSWGSSIKCNHKTRTYFWILTSGGGEKHPLLIIKGQTLRFSLVLSGCPIQGKSVLEKNICVLFNFCLKKNFLF